MTTPAPDGTERRVLVVDRAGDLAQRLRNAVPGVGGVVEACADLGAAEARLAGESWDVLVAGPSVMHRAGFRRLSSLHQRYPRVSVVLAVTDRPRADLAEIVQVGADDLLPLQADDAELGRALARAARITRGRVGVPPAPARGGRVVTIASASGGCGKTFVAANAAEFLARTTDQPVVLVDLDLQFGEVCTALRLPSHLTIADALAAEAEGHDLNEHLDDYLLQHPDGFSVLAAPRHPAEADAITPGDVVRILDFLRARGAWVVIDTSAGLGELLLAAIETTDHLFALATPDRPSLVNLATFLKAVDRLGMAAGGNVSVILNKADPDLGLGAAEMALELGRPFEAVLPYAREVARSVNLGVPLLVSEPKCAVASALRAALKAAVPDDTAGENSPGARVLSSARRLLSRRPKPDPVECTPTTVPTVAAPPAPLPLVQTPDVEPEGELPTSAPSLRSARTPRPLHPSRPAATGRQDRTRPCSSPLQRSGRMRPSMPPLATIGCRERGPPKRTIASAPGPPGRMQRAGSASIAVRPRPLARPPPAVPHQDKHAVH